MTPYDSAGKVVSLLPLTSIKTGDTQGPKLFRTQFAPSSRYKISLNANPNILSSHQAYKGTEIRSSPLS